MRRGTKLVIAMLIAGAAGGARAADCHGGAIHGSTSPNGPPDENTQCQIMGRIFCSLSDYRNADVDQVAAVDRTADWLKDLGRTGSHRTQDYRPAVRAAAAYIYAHEKMPPFTAYNYAVWTCGVNQRIPDPAAQKKIGPRWEELAQSCETRFPGEGDGARNQKLKDCLDAAMKDLVQDQSTKIGKK